ncbi:DUF1707 domain-containing protein [Nocardioides sp. CFH 31398]|uniref:DUF1707 SHOCT-like domain-containing protein n=1 Tax=Nocardioides sp. CFH 31398 TaxID=2919579 RepID=UPI001F05CAF9|nr:DUF1707 domain-containing protein [Nocardioides sp. CFH 31398]MCH1868129.1 DUF1707 domain-containing protein [Nocardioides sp. CFH 31398]
MSDPALQRVSDAERQQVAEVLRTAAGEGRLDLDELDERLESTWTAKTYADLVPVLVDLPEQAPTPPGAAVAHPGSRSPHGRNPATAAAVEHGSSIGVLSEQKRTGVWRVPPTHTATAVLGAVTIDLREAVFVERETVIQANAVLGAVEVYVDAETAVVVDGTPVLGDVTGVKDKVPADLHDGSPVVRVKGLAILGSVTVIRKAMPGERTKGWRWH